MTSQEIRTQVSPMIIWMADATIREARRAITGNTGWNDVKRSPYNLPEVEMAGEVLFRMFDACSASIRIALLTMPEKMDGFLSYPDSNYLDEFVASLNSHLLRSRSLDEPMGTELRKSDWVLGLC